MVAASRREERSRAVHRFGTDVGSSIGTDVGSGIGPGIGTDAGSSIGA
ncbi:MAG TPA: hypothetical protein VEJ87_05730 [Acidimicrobiales bacterium]|nr:hypothetical protein [Acidimicrobiales bacterium]